MRGGVAILLPHLILLLGVLSVSGASVLFQFATAPPLVVAFYRLAFSVLLLTGPLLWRRAEWPVRKDLWLSVVSGLFLACHFAAWFLSLTLTSIASSTVLVNTHPFLVLLFGYLVMGERTTRRAFAGVSLAVLGAALVGWGDFILDEDSLFGDVWAFIGAIAVSGYLLIGHHVRQRVGALLYSTIAYGSATLTLLLLIFLQGGALSGFQPINWWVFVGLAVFPTIFGHTLFNWALKYLPTSVISVNVLGEPIGATLLAWLIWGRIPGSMTLAGGSLILVGIAVFLRFHQMEKMGQ